MRKLSLLLVILLVTACYPPEYMEVAVVPAPTVYVDYGYPYYQFYYTGFPVFVSVYQRDFVYYYPSWRPTVRSRYVAPQRPYVFKSPIREAVRIMTRDQERMHQSPRPAPNTVQRQNTNRNRVEPKAPARPRLERRVTPSTPRPQSRQPAARPTAPVRRPTASPASPRRQPTTRRPGT